MVGVVDVGDLVGFVVDGDGEGVVVGGAGEVVPRVAAVVGSGCGVELERVGDGDVGGSACVLGGCAGGVGYVDGVGEGGEGEGEEEKREEIGVRVVHV